MLGLCSRAVDFNIAQGQNALPGLDDCYHLSTSLAWVGFRRPFAYTGSVMKANLRMRESNITTWLWHRIQDHDEKVR